MTAILVLGASGRTGAHAMDYVLSRGHNEVALPITLWGNRSRTPSSMHEHLKVNVCAETDGVRLRLQARDDGSGLTGLMDRVEALGGHMQISSQVGNGTAISVEIPFELRMTECGSSGR